MANPGSQASHYHSMLGGQGSVNMPTFAPSPQPSATSPTTHPPPVPNVVGNSHLARLVLYTLPVELTQGIYRALPLLIDQVHLVQALVSSGDGEDAMSILAQVASDEFFLNKTIAKFLFGKDGIKGHNGLHPTEIKATANDPYHADGFIESYRTLIRIAKRARNFSAEHQLQQTYNAKSVNYRRKAVQESRQQRCGMKPTPRHKRKLGLLMKDKRTYKELEHAFERQEDKLQNVRAARNEQEGQNLIAGRNFEVLEALCNALAQNSLIFASICRGCVQSISNPQPTGELSLPFCYDCQKIYCAQTMIDGSFFDVLNLLSPDMFTEVVRGYTLWRKPISTGNGLDTKYYVTEAEAKAFRSMLYTPLENVATVEALAQLRQLPEAKILHINLRFRWILEAIMEAATQCGRTDGMFKGTWWLSRHPPRDLTGYGLPPWFMNMFADNFGARIESFGTAQEMVDFFGEWYDVGSVWTPAREVLERYRAVASFWRDFTQENLNGEDCNALYQALAIVPVPEWTQWLESDSHLHPLAHSVDRATAYCRLIHRRSPADIITAITQNHHSHSPPWQSSNIMTITRSSHNSTYQTRVTYSTHRLQGSD